MGENKRERFTAWITKYALTEGIFTKVVELCANISDDMVSVVHGPANICYHGKDWHRTKEAAADRARQMQANKLKSIDQQRARIAALKF